MEKWFSIRCKLTKKVSGLSSFPDESLLIIIHYTESIIIIPQTDSVITEQKTSKIYIILKAINPRGAFTTLLVPDSRKHHIFPFSTPAAHRTCWRRSCGLQHIHAPATSVTSHGNTHLSQNCAHSFLLTPTSLFCLHALAAPTTINANGYNVPRHLLD